MTALFARPHGDTHVELTTAPVLESWNASTHPDQQRLNAYLDVVAAQLRLAERPASEQWAVELTVGLPEKQHLDLGGRDLDNYLFPLARRLDHRRVCAAFGRKVHQAGSSIALISATPRNKPGPPPQLRVRTSVSTESVLWKEAIHQACGDAALVSPLPSGPLALEIRFGVSSIRNWTTLWKPAIDALGPVLGLPNPEKRFSPDDDRIVDLGLHRHVDDSLGYDVDVQVWWRPTDR